MAATTQPIPVDPLANLRDIHLPDPVSTLPLAPGWWLLGGLVLLIIVMGLMWIYRRWQQQAYRREGLTELRLLLERYQLDHNEQGYLLDLSTLLKRIAMAHYPRVQVASLSGIAWLEFLDKTSNCREFTMGTGQVLADGQYLPQATFNPDDLYTQVRQWIKHHD